MTGEQLNQFMRPGEAPRGFLPQEERTFLESQRALLEQTEGWGKMTRRQKAIILASLSIEWKIARKKRINEKADTLLWHTHCLLAVNFVEEEVVPSGTRVREEHENLLHSNLQIFDWKKRSALDEVMRKGQNGEYPSVLFLGKDWSAPNERNDEKAETKEITRDHAVILLGDIENKEDILLWEKENSRQGRFKLNKLSTLLRSFSYCDYFAIRPLENRASLIAKGWLPEEK